MITSPLWLLYASCAQIPGCGPSDEIVGRENVEGVVFASESAVTYRDGVTRIGVFFDEQHRQALTFDQLPVAWMVGIVAAEDGRYWSHPGVDAEHIARAARDNLEAGAVVAGGSTLTQQTAKMLFERPDRSLDAKFQELDYALQLEKEYSKREILTYYANLFHVTGNGSGLAIAARYFFDKEPSELTVLECAYISGLVKGPANYDPFPGDAAQQAEATRRAVERTRYVLSRIGEESLSNLVPKAGEGKTVTEADVEVVRAEAKRLLAEGFTLPFRPGVFRYDTSAVLDEVTRRLTSEPIASTLKAAGVTDPSTAGLTVVTTLDPAVQHEATYGLWHQLSDLGTMLEAIPASAYVQDADPPRPDPNHPPRRHEFRPAKIARHVEVDGSGSLVADLGGFECALDRDAMVRAASAVHRGTVQDRYAKVATASVDQLVADLKDDTVVWVSVRDVTSSAATCDLEVRPELQGSVVVVEDGQLRAMVGGSTNKDFNRATAPRQMGSTFKTLIYHSALTLGWQPDDVLDNRRHVFPFSGTYYEPSPDHEPKDWVSMAWAGVNSENLASIWLLYHLTDALSDAELERLADTTGLSKAAGESAEAYQTRIQKAGILPTKGRVPESWFLAARRDVVESLLAEGKDEEARELRSVLYGWGFADQQRKADSDSRAKFDNSWQRLEGMVTSCKAQYDLLDHGRGSDLSTAPGTHGLQVACGTRPDGFGSAEVNSLAAPPSPFSALQKPEPAKAGKGKGGKGGKGGKTPTEAPDPEPQPSRPSGRLAPVEEMWIDGRITLGTIESVQAAMTRRQLAYESSGDLYAPVVLYHHQDFRALLGIKYVEHLARTYGVKTDLAEVMSLPLGASEITLEEATRLYEGLVSGRTYKLGGTGLTGVVGELSTPTVLISLVKDRHGNVLYKADPKPVPVGGDAAGQMTADILRNVVQYGTGKSAKEVAKLGEALVPLGGKTGTTNDFKNAAFMGYLPAAGASGFSAADGVSVGVYVGYDDNRPMKVGKISVAGSVGALPAWITTVQGWRATHPEKAPTASPEGGFWPLTHGSDVVYRAVSTSDGQLDESGGARVLTRVKRLSGPPAVAADPAAPAPDRPTRGRKKNWWQVW